MQSQYKLFRLLLGDGPESYKYLIYISDINGDSLECFDEYDSEEEIILLFMNIAERELSSCHLRDVKYDFENAKLFK